MTRGHAAVRAGLSGITAADRLLYRYRRWGLLRQDEKDGAGCRKRREDVEPDTVLARPVVHVAGDDRSEDRADDDDAVRHSHDRGKGLAPEVVRADRGHLRPSKAPCE